MEMNNFNCFYSKEAAIYSQPASQPLGIHECLHFPVRSLSIVDGSSMISYLLSHSLWLANRKMLKNVYVCIK